MLLILLLLIFVHFVYISRDKCRDEIKTIIVQLRFNSFGFLDEKKTTEECEQKGNLSFDMKISKQCANDSSKVKLRYDEYALNILPFQTCL